jgi:hypothetical protein
MNFIRVSIFEMFLKIALRTPLYKGRYNDDDRLEVFLYGEHKKYEWECDIGSVDSCSDIDVVAFSEFDCSMVGDNHFIPSYVATRAIFYDKDARYACYLIHISLS